MRYGVTRYNAPLLGRFLGKLFDVLPAALASAIGGFLFTHYQGGRAPEPVAAQVAPASVEMMQLLRDEHGLIVNFLKAQLANQKKQLAIERDAAHVAAPAEPAMAPPSPRQAVVAMGAAKPTAPRIRPPVVGAAPPPVVIAQAPQDESAKRTTGNGDSLLARTIGLKDNVVAVTYRVVSAIGGIPSWIGSIGGHFGGEGANPPPRAQLVSSS